jgi:hypothetical protein
MSANRRVCGAITAVALTLVAATALIASAAEPTQEFDGLVRVNSRQLDNLYVLPGADFSRFTRVHLDPVDVSFSERWDPNRSRSGSRRLTTRDIENIRSTVATEFERSFAAELARSGYTLVTESGDDVLRVTPFIVNLYITAPGTQTTQGRTRTFVANTGQMTLVAVARDSITGEFLARAIDTQTGRRTGTMQLSSSVANMADARRAFTTWARVLRTGLDEARRNAGATAGASETGAPAKQSEGSPQ